MASVLPLSVAIITFNEEKNLPDCLNSLPQAEEVVIVDSLSTDKTPEICEKFGVKFISRPFSGHVQQKQFAVDACKNDWVFCIDADERFSEKLRESIHRLFENPLPLFGYKVNRKNFHFGRWIRHGGWYPDARIRLFHRKHGYWGGYNPHDTVKIEGKAGHLKGDLIHYTFRDLSHNVRTNDNYSSIMAENLFTEGKKFSLLKLLFKPPWKFFDEYFLRRGFLDKTPGFIIAVGSAYSMFLKQAKLWEKHQKK